MAYVQYRARKCTYDCASDRWDEQDVTIRICRESFGEGGMRIVHRAREVLDDGSEVECVVKRIRPGVGLEPDSNIHEAVTQMVADSYAQDFNKACAAAGLSHRIAFLPVSVIRLEGSSEPLCLEPYLAGEYVKHNDNAGHTETDDEVAGAFSYFTYVTSGKSLIVCDIQGVGTFYTDPQIHTEDGNGFGSGNLGSDGIDRFMRTHRHTLLCEQLGLPNPDAELSDEQLAAKLQAAERAQAEEEMAMRSGGFPVGFALPGLRLGGLAGPDLRYWGA
eukprot:TRINITY_DN55444_c0_g1_i1.p1 TRINITY_DN55444_c0_g1~~TRINITY_DN55444_c0_g1_i1.p1  ORF type:complete len:275 (+),score=31.05 TRINITY_DN55444_c0_g1_i1:49-873(+)